MKILHIGFDGIFQAKFVQFPTILMNLIDNISCWLCIARGMKETLTGTRNPSKQKNIVKSGGKSHIAPKKIKIASWFYKLKLYEKISREAYPRLLEVKNSNLLATNTNLM